MTPSRIAILSVLVLSCVASPLSAAELSSDQRTQLLQEATTVYDQGLRSIDSDVAAAKDFFATAANKYRLLVASGIENPRLYENLGNASLQGGRLGEAIAAFEHAAALAPNDGNIRRHLEHARSLRSGESNAEETGTVMDQLAGWNQSVPMSLRLSVGLLAWTLLWTSLMGLLVAPSTRWRRSAFAAGVITALMIGSVGWDWSRFSGTEFGIVTDPATLRTHNGETFPPVLDQPLSEGTRFDLVERRGDWLHVRLTDGTNGWIPDRTADVILPAATPWG